MVHEQVQGSWDADPYGKVIFVTLTENSSIVTNDT